MFEMGGNVLRMSTFYEMANFFIKVIKEGNVGWKL